ncbi:hypothetical protein KI387_037741, partial [Taxus chinensis]
MNAACVEWMGICFVVMVSLLHIILDVLVFQELICLKAHGAAGFIVSYVANDLVRKYPEYKIVVLDKVDYCSNLKNLLPSKSFPNFKFVWGDIANAHL